ncbi:MAG: ATP-binding protein [Bacteroidales bacterium]|nr:ATP-binding protein [Bacteroidales bacterium]
MFDSHNQAFRKKTLRKDITSYLKGENPELPEIQHFIYSFIEGSITPTLLFDVSGELIIANQSFIDLWDTDSRQDLASFNIFSDRQLKDAGIMPMIEQAFRGQIPESVELFYDPALSSLPGRPRWIRAKAYPLRASNGSVNFVTVLMEDITEQKFAEDKATHYLETLKSFMNSVNDALVIYDDQLNFVEINDLALQQIKKTRSEVLGKNIREIIPGIETTQRYRHYLNVLESGKPYEEEVDDHPFTPEKVLLIKAFKTINGMGIITSDITGTRKALQNELRQRREMEILRDSAMDFVELSHSDDLFALTAQKLSNICEGSTVIINMLDESTGRIVIKGIAGYAEQCAEASKLIGASLLGKSFPNYDHDSLSKTGKLELISKSLCEIVGGEIPESVCKQIEKQLNISKIYTIGFTRKENLYGNALILTSDTELGLNSQLIETFINQLSIALYRFRSEKAYHDSELRFKMTFGTSPDAVNINRLKDGKYIDVNEGFTAVTGYTREEIIGSSSLEKDIWADRNDRNFLIKELNERGFVKNLEAGFVVKDGSKKVGLMSASKFTKDGEDYIISITRDITDRFEYEEKLKEARKKAEESDRLKTAFLANISHEVRTPMNAILGFSDLLMNPNTSEKNRNEYISHIHKSSHNLLSIINDIIDFSMIETGQLQIYNSECSVNNILDDLLATFRQYKHMVGKEHLDIRLAEKLMDDNSFIRSDEERIKQLMSNLIGNAIKYTEKGSVQFGCRILSEGEDMDKLQFFVIDTGIGIPVDKHEVIFERFRQLDDSNTRKYGGNGLGLSITKQIAGLLDGDISLESTPGKGSSFYFTLPYVPVSRPVPQSSNEKDIPLFDWKDKKVIVAEDVMTNFILIKSMLEETSVNISWARHGEEVLSFMRSGIHFDMILMDVRMPKMNGYEATWEIRKMNPSIPVIALSANALQSDVDTSLRNGCNDHITKPVKREVLLSTMAKFFDQKG